MLSYDMNARGETSRYEYLYQCIRSDIVAGRISAGEKLPSKRRLAQHLGVGLVTVESAYAQLVAEGYVRSHERRGYFAQELPQSLRPDVRLANGAFGQAEDTGQRARQTPGNAALALPAPKPLVADFSRPGTGGFDAVGAFWTRALRSCMSHESYEDLFGPQPVWGNERLRCAIAAYLRGARGMGVDPDRIFIGAGAQMLYDVVVKLLGPNRVYAVEDPGYPRLADTYRADGARVAFVSVDDEGMSVDALRATDADVAHITPSHQFPTGRPMTVARRYQVLSWAYEAPERAIVEDDYDWEFRFSGMPIPSLAAIDAGGRVCYLSTFSKSLSSALRIAYLVVPQGLAGAAEERLSFYANTVSAIQQIALARTLESGAYERHLSRYRKQQREVRDALIDALKAQMGAAARILEADSGLHFVLEIDSSRTEDDIARRALDEGVRLAPLGSYVQQEKAGSSQLQPPRFVVQYAGLSLDKAQEAARIVAGAAR